MKRNGFIGWGLALVVSCLVATIAGADSHEGETDSKSDQGRMKHGSHQPMHDNRNDHKGMHKEMRAQMQAHDARLDELVAAMNGAKGDAKVDAIAAVLNELVAQRRTRRSHMDERWKKQEGKPGMGKKGAKADQD